MTSFWEPNFIGGEAVSFLYNSFRTLLLVNERKLRLELASSSCRSAELCCVGGLTAVLCRWFDEVACHLSALSHSLSPKLWSLKRFLRDLGVTGPPRGAFTLSGPDSIYQISL